MRPLRVLFVEDNPDDVVLIARELQRAGFTVDPHRVETAEEMEQALESAWDFVIADHVLPAFSGREALRMLDERHLDLPCIIVSGRSDEQVAVDAMRSGARDYVLKDRLARLPAAIDRELREATERRARAELERRLVETERAHEAVLVSRATRLAAVAGLGQHSLAGTSRG